jgi:transposase
VKTCFDESVKALTIAEAKSIILGLQDEIRRWEESRYDHRLHGVLLVAQGLTCPEVAAMLGDSARTVEYWVRGFEEKGFGRPAGGRTMRATEMTKRKATASGR